jgi:hypothetical protein
MFPLIDSLQGWHITQPDTQDQCSLEHLTVLNDTPENSDIPKNTVFNTNCAEDLV